MPGGSECRRARGERSGNGTDAERLEEYERFFRRAGLPLFSEDISAWEDIVNLALLGLIYAGVPAPA